MGEELLLGVDVGTSSTKGALVRPDGEVVATAQRPHEVVRPRPGWVEQSTEVWWEDLRAICAELVPQGDSSPAALGVSGMGPCVVAADADGHALRNAILYGIDTRATAEIRELTERYGEDEILARCGSPLTSQAVGPKLLWLVRHEPDVWARTKKFLTLSSYLVHRLTGEYVLDHHLASQSDPLYDLQENRWIDEWAEDIAPGLELPRLLWPWEVAGELTAEAAEATGLAAGTPVIAGTIDTWAEAASLGIRRPGDMMLMYGTTMFVIEVLAHAHADPRLWCTASLRPGTRNLAAGMATSGALAAWLRGIVGDLPFEQLLEEAEAVAPGAEGLIALPYFAGERAPLFDPAARGVIAGLTLRHGRGHLFRALLEGTAYAVRHILETMAEVGGAGRRLVAVGGGTQGHLWTQVVSDVTGLIQQMPARAIGASYGDAFMAGRALGLVRPDAEWNRMTAEITPDPSTQEVYGRQYEIFRELYPATREQVHALAALQEAGGGGVAAGAGAPPAATEGAISSPP